jgi:hypothetical protein
MAQLSIGPARSSLAAQYQRTRVLHRAFGVREDTVRLWRSEKDFRWRRPRHTLKGRQIADEIDRTAVRLHLRKAQAEAGDFNLHYGDKGGVLTQPYAEYGPSPASGDDRFAR